MRSFLLLACAAVFMGAASTSVAQQPAQPSRPRTPAPRGDECTTVEGRTECRRVFERTFGGDRMDSVLNKRAALGLQLSPTGTARDTLGVFVAAVTPKGPAETAGIYEGDRIVSINGIDLRVSKGDVEDSYASGLASHRLSREVGKLTPGSKVNLRVYSGGRVRDVQVTAARASDLMRTRGFFNLGIGGPDNTWIYRDGMPMTPMTPMAPMPPMPPMAPMAPMAPMPPMAPMAPMPPGEMWTRMAPMGDVYRLRTAPTRVMEMMPLLRGDAMRGMERQLRDFPRVYRMDGEHFKMLSPSRLRSPHRIHELRTRNGVKPTESARLKVEKEQKAKAKADSLKK
jgi:hypothetical protein